MAKTRKTTYFDSDVWAEIGKRTGGFRQPSKVDFINAALRAYIEKGPAKDGPQTNDERDAVRLLLSAWRSESVDNRLVRGILEQWHDLAARRREAGEQ